MVLDEPTNDLDMETLDLLEDLLADYDGTLILVSHDRDFVDRLASSTIALDGRGAAVETPGGWTDFMRQNPGFFDTAQAPATRPRAAIARGGGRRRQDRCRAPSRAGRRGAAWGRNPAPSRQAHLQGSAPPGPRLERLMADLPAEIATA